MQIRLLLAAVVIGCVLFFVGFQDWRLALKARPQPQLITAAQLEANGPGDNAHIRMSDFLMCEWSFVYETTNKNKDSKWKWVWVPVVPLNGPFAQSLNGLAPGMQPPTPSQVRIIVKSSKCETEHEVHAMAARDTLDGTVINEIASLGGEEKKLLAESYPGIDFSRCWIVETYRKPADASRVIGFMGAGGMIALAAGAFLLSQMKNA